MATNEMATWLRVTDVYGTTSVVTAGQTTHGVPFVSAIARQGLVGVQFHPERSGGAGLRLLENFLRFADAEAAA